MRFSIPQLLIDVKEFQDAKKKLNKMKKEPKYFWQKQYSHQEIDNAFKEYIKKMKILEENYNPNYYNNLRKICHYNKTPIKMLPSAPPEEMIC